MATVTFEGEAIHIDPQGLERFTGFQGPFTIDLTDITSVRVDSEITRYFPGFRAPGLVWFARKIGTFRRKGMKAYWNTSRHGDTLVIECPGATFDRVVLTVADPADARDRILAAKG